MSTSNIQEVSTRLVESLREGCTPRQVSNTEALVEAVHMYWDRGMTLPEIKSTLRESLGLDHKSVQGVIQELGKAIANFGSDLGAPFVVRQLLG